MLCEITIENVAVIEKATAVFLGGFNVLTGETGAGKSMLIDSINAILGSRTSREIVRSGAGKAKIWARFNDLHEDVWNHLEELGYSPEEELLLYREITSDGKSVCRINGAPATASVLKDVCGGLIQIHGQHDNQSLMNASKHIQILDNYASNGELLAQYHKKHAAFLAVKKELEQLENTADDKERRLDILNYEASEIEKAELDVGEEEELTEKRSIIRNSQTILEGIQGAYYSLAGDDEDVGAVTLLAQASQSLSRAAAYSGELEELGQVLNDVYYSVSEAASDLQNRLPDFQFGAEELDQIEQRLDLIYRLKQKYGANIEEIIQYGARARQEIETISGTDERIEVLRADLAKIDKEQDAIAKKLSESRRKAFDILNQELTKALEFLNMPGIRLALKHTTIPSGSNGQDDIEFLMSVNPGEEPRPLAKIASGGELARIMLALKSALAEKDDLATVIYDEIDTGISGVAASRVGQMLCQTAQGRQVICVTHTAQIAAYATNHLLIQKNVKDGRTYTDICELDRPERIHELARIISGDKVTPLALANAEEMISNSQV